MIDWSELSLSVLPPFISIVFELSASRVDRHIENEAALFLEKEKITSEAMMEFKYWIEGLLTYRTAGPTALAPLLVLATLLVVRGFNIVLTVYFCFALLFLIVMSRLSISRGFLSMSTDFVGRKLRLPRTRLLMWLTVGQNLIAIAVISLVLTHLL